MKAKALVTCQSSALGGVERRLLDEVGVLQDMGLEVWLAPSRFPGHDSWISQMQDLGARLYGWRPYKFIERQQAGFPFPMLGEWGRHRLSQQGFRFAHVALPWTRVGLSRVHDLAIAGVPVTLGLHCTYPRESWDPRLDPFISRALAGVAAAYAVSEPVKQSFLANFDRLRPDLGIDVLHNGIDTGRFISGPEIRRNARKTLGLAPDDEVIAVCGRLDEFKRPGLALEAFAMAQRIRPHLKLVYLGEGPLRPVLERRVAELGIGARVLFTGYVEDVHEVLPAADLYVSPTSAGEGFGLAPAEALSCGIPAILSDTPAIREVFADCAEVTLLGANDADSWSQALLQRIEQAPGSMANTAQAARSFVVNRLERVRMTKALQDFYAPFI